MPKWSLCVSPWTLNGTMFVPYNGDHFYLATLPQTPLLTSCNFRMSYKPSYNTRDGHSFACLCVYVALHVRLLASLRAHSAKDVYGLFPYCRST